MVVGTKEGHQNRHVAAVGVRFRLDMCGFEFCYGWILSQNLLFVLVYFYFLVCSHTSYIYIKIKITF
jgi:hypothetical protein